MAPEHERRVTPAVEREVPGGRMEFEAVDLDEQAPLHAQVDASHSRQFDLLPDVETPPLQPLASNRLDPGIRSRSSLRRDEPEAEWLAMEDAPDRWRIDKAFPDGGVECRNGCLSFAAPDHRSKAVLE